MKYFCAEQDLICQSIYRQPRRSLYQDKCFDPDETGSEEALLGETKDVHMTLFSLR